MASRYSISAAISAPPMKCASCRPLAADEAGPVCGHHFAPFGNGTVCAAPAFHQRGSNLMESSMRKSTVAVLGAVILAGATTVSAKADVHQIGSVNVAADHYTDV